MVNECACKTLGYSSDGVAMTFFDIDPAITDEKIRAILEQLETSGSVTHETVHRRRDAHDLSGGDNDNQQHRIPWNDMFYSFAKDISERKQAEQALRESEEDIPPADRDLPQRHHPDQGRTHRVRQSRCREAISGLKAEELAGSE